MSHDQHQAPAKFECFVFSVPTHCAARAWRWLPDMFFFKLRLYQPLHFGKIYQILLFILFFRNAQQTKREIRMAYMTFFIVGIFLSFNLPRIVVAGYEVSQTWLILHCVQNGSEYMPVLPFYYWDSISRLFMVINSSLNFLVYCTGSDQFKVI